MAVLLFKQILHFTINSDFELKVRTKEQEVSQDVLEREDFGLFKA
jgi:hypothetical protein